MQNGELKTSVSADTLTNALGIVRRSIPNGTARIAYISLSSASASAIVTKVSDLYAYAIVWANREAVSYYSYTDSTSWTKVTPA